MLKSAARVRVRRVPLPQGTRSCRVPGPAGGASPRGANAARGKKFEAGSSPRLRHREHDAAGIPYAMRLSTAAPRGTAPRSRAARARAPRRGRRIRRPALACRNGGAAASLANADVGRMARSRPRGSEAAQARGVAHRGGAAVAPSRRRHRGRCTFASFAASPFAAVTYGCRPVLWLKMQNVKSKVFRSASAVADTRRMRTRAGAGVLQRSGRFARPFFATQVPGAAPAGLQSRHQGLDPYGTDGSLRFKKAG